VEVLSEGRLGGVEEGGREVSSEAGATTTMPKSTSKKVNNLNVHILLEQLNLVVHSPLGIIRCIFFNAGICRLVQWTKLKGRLLCGEDDQNRFAGKLMKVYKMNF
jgi:hypothetical protein